MLKKIKKLLKTNFKSPRLRIFLVLAVILGLGQLVYAQAGGGQPTFFVAWQPNTLDPSMTNGQIEAGKTYKISFTFTNSSGNFYDRVFARSYIKNFGSTSGSSWGNTVEAFQSNPTASEYGIGTQGFVDTCEAPYPNCVYWKYQKYPSRQATTATMSFQTASNAPEGSQICLFTTIISEANPSQRLSQDNQQCFTITKPGGGAYTVSWLGNTTPLITGNQVEAGKTYTIPMQLDHPGSAGSDLLWILGWVGAETGDKVQSFTFNESIPASTSKSGFYPENCFYYTCYSYLYDTYPGGQTTQGSFTLTVSSSAQPGAQLCFAQEVRHRSTKLLLSNQIERCFTVSASTGGSGQPYLYALGNLHAGAAFGDQSCLLDEGTEEVRGHTNNNQSRADYAVSAAGIVSNFGSAGSPTSSALTFGNQPAFGRYGRVCRPDVAKQFIDDPTTYPVTSPNDVNLSTLTTSGVYRYNGNVTLSGRVGEGKRITIIVDGNIALTGNIGFYGDGSQGGESYASRSRIPSLGVIATNVINIDPAATSIYGIYYAGSAAGSFGNAGQINTCQSGHSSALSSIPSSCSSALTVRGALIGSKIYFRRTSTSGAAETVNYLPLLKLRPPIGLSGVLSPL